MMTQPVPRPDIRDPVCGMRVQPETAPGGRVNHQGTDYYFCSPGCAEKFRAHPELYPAARPQVHAPDATHVRTTENKPSLWRRLWSK